MICELLPAVTLPYLRSKNGLSFARFSGVESSRTPSSGRVERARFVVERHDFVGEVPGASARRARAGGCARRTRPSRARVMPKRYARFSAVWPISRPHDRIGEALHEADHRREVARAGTSPASAARWPSVFAAYQFATATPPSRRRRAAARATAHRRRRRARGCERPARMLLIAESIACMPDAQLRITVQPGTFSPQPMRSAATRPMLTSSADGAAQPRITSSSSRRLERLAQQQRAPGVGREVGRRERPRPVARLEERRARAVDDVDRLVSWPSLVLGVSRAARQRRRALHAADMRRRVGDRRRLTGVATATRRDPARNRRRGSRCATSSRCAASARASSAVITPAATAALGERVDARARRAAWRRARPSVIAARSFASIGSAAIVAVERALDQRAPDRRRRRAMNMPAVSRSRVADGAIRSARHLVAERVGRHDVGPAEREHDPRAAAPR